jgi:hypothetical protein
VGIKCDAYENAVAESFFATLNKELIHRRSWRTRRELIGSVFGPPTGSSTPSPRLAVPSC